MQVQPYTVMQVMNDLHSYTITARDIIEEWSRRGRKGELAERQLCHGAAETVA